MYPPAPFHTQRRALSVTKANKTAPLSKPLKRYPKILINEEKKIDSISISSLASRTLKTVNLCFKYAIILELQFTKATLLKFKPEDKEIHMTADIG